jgi:hypothetical protein
MTASTRPEILGCELGEPGGAHGGGKVNFISDKRIEEIRSEVFVSKCGIGIGIEICERMLGSHFGRVEEC